MSACCPAHKLRFHAAGNAKVMLQASLTQSLLISDSATTLRIWAYDFSR